MTKEFLCNCESEFQDQLYGKNIRLFNEMSKGNSHSGWRCTVCGNEIKDYVKKK